MAKQVPARNGGTLTRPDKGETMNPNGRPRKLPELDGLLADVLGEEKDGITAADAILRKVRQMAASGNIRAIEILLDRAYGKPKQSTEITGKDGGPLIGFDTSKLTLDEKRQLLALMEKTK